MSQIVPRALIVVTDCFLSDFFRSSIVDYITSPRLPYFTSLHHIVVHFHLFHVHHAMNKTTLDSILTHASDVQYSAPEDKSWRTSKQFHYQVAGHFNEVILSLSQTKILKPIIKPDLFLRELLVYEKSQSPKDVTKQLPLAAFMCRYHGLYIDREDTDSQEISGLYLILEDLTFGFRKPCICDIKMGTQTFEPTVDPEKMQRRIDKFRYQEQFGFRISGLKVYDVTTSTYRSYDKQYGRSATPENISEKVLSIFHNGSVYRRGAISSVLALLRSIHEYMCHQTDFKFYSSSLLIIYEGDILATADATEPEPVSECRSPVCKMIDFAHTLETSATDPDPIDRGYILGLETIIYILQRHLGSI